MAPRDGGLAEVVLRVREGAVEAPVAAPEGLEEGLGGGDEGEAQGAGEGLEEEDQGRDGEAAGGEEGPVYRRQDVPRARAGEEGAGLDDHGDTGGDVEGEAEGGGEEEDAEGWLVLALALASDGLPVAPLESQDAGARCEVLVGGREGVPGPEERVAVQGEEAVPEVGEAQRVDLFGFRFRFNIFNTQCKSKSKSK